MVTSQEMKARLERRGFRKLGAGLFSVVYGHPTRKDIAVKVSDSHDLWPDYVTWATINGYAGQHAPKVFNLKHYGDFYVAVMERLVDTISGIRYEYSAHNGGEYRDSANPYDIDGWYLRDSKDKDLAEFAKDMEASGFAGDLHDGNVMVRHNGQIVVTDPSSARDSTKPVIRRGEVIAA